MSFSCCSLISILVAWECLRAFTASSLATRIDIRLQQENDIIILQVSDNGAGFSTPPDDQSIHHGLASIQEQVSFLNGKMTIKENPEGGTKVSIFIPMKGDESYASFIGR